MFETEFQRDARSRSTSLLTRPLAEEDPRNATAIVSLAHCTARTDKPIGVVVRYPAASGVTLSI